MAHGACIGLLIVVALAVTGMPTVSAQPSIDVTPVQRVVDDYISLYRKDALAEWKALFLPGFTASYTNDDGSVTTRGLDDFFERQRAAFARGPVAERLANVRIQRAGHLAQVFADFYFTSGKAPERHGQLMLLLLETHGTFKIAALGFTYHLAK